MTTYTRWTGHEDQEVVQVRIYPAWEGVRAKLHRIGPGPATFQVPALIDTVPAQLARGTTIAGANNVPLVVKLDDAGWLPEWGDLLEAD